MMAHACNPNTREIRRSRKRSFGWSQLHSETLLQTNKQTNKNGGPSWEKRELLLAMTLGSNSLDLLLLNKVTQARLMTRFEADCHLLHAWDVPTQPGSRQVGSLEEHCLEQVVGSIFTYSMCLKIRSTQRFLSLWL